MRSSVTQVCTMISFKLLSFILIVEVAWYGMVFGEDSKDGTFIAKVQDSDSLFNMYDQHPRYRNSTVCKGFGSDVLRRYVVDPLENYKELKRRLNRNCTHISGNLIIKHIAPINGKEPDLSFLWTIEEVSGYVMIYGNSISEIRLPNLRIIRGETGFPFGVDRTRYSLFVFTNHHKVVKYLRVLDLHSLTSIINYNVLFASNVGLCFTPYTVNWTDILENPEKQRVVFHDAQKDRIAENFCKKKYEKYLWRPTGQSMPRFWTNNTICSDSCPSYNGRRFCWGKGPDMCQSLKKCQRITCSGSNRCYKLANGAEKCCHYECAAGCSNGKDTGCEACRLFINDEKCVNHCPGPTKYDRKKFVQMPNPDYRLTMGPMCVKKCARGLVKYKDDCVESCNKVDHRLINNECVPYCKDGVCPKKCFIQEIEDRLRKRRPDFLKKHMLFTFRSVLNELQNCTIVQGQLIINKLTKKDNYNPHLKNEHWSLEDFWKLRNIREFEKSRIMVDLALYPEIQNLTFFQNLRVLKHTDFFLTHSQVKYLGWLNVHEVNESKFRFSFNKRLCYLRYLPRQWGVKRGVILIKRGRADKKNCRNKRCDPMCDRRAGCIGPGPSMCFKCRGFLAGNTCVKKCENLPGYHSFEIRDGKRGRHTNKICGRCHPQCKSNCTGPHPHECVGGCKTLTDGKICVEKCPSNKYADAATAACVPCKEACIPFFRIRESSPYCTGPTSFPGKNGCSFCESISLNRQGKPLSCWSECPIGTYTKILTRALYQSSAFVNITQNVIPMITRICLPCHEECATCSAPGPYSCDRCKHFKFMSKCVSECPSDKTYNISSVSSEEFPISVPKCLPCHPQCRKGCAGPSSWNCNNCLVVKIPFDDGTKWRCNDTCPEDKPFEMFDKMTGDTVCSDTKSSSLLESKSRLRIIVPIVFVLFLIAAFIVLIVCCLLRQRAVAKQETVRLQAKYTGALPDEEMEPLNPSNSQPNYTQLRIINERELRRGQIIGSGAFGTVYKAQWIPPMERDERQVTIPVAIKLLTDATDQLVNKELLEEARVMASVDNSYCMRLIGVCMTAQLQLVSQFMPLGSLLEYLRKNSSSISSQALLTWAHQIAKGMVYLESRSIIHRDLAARNVLVQDPSHVRITDFGLAKLLDINEDEYLATGGKMPVKWLALECIRQRRFTHKSDVWAYGVTLWELFTFGERPYPDLRAAQVCDFLESGERLQQPEIVTLDVYMLMIKCWMLDEDSRPNFSELADEVKRMSRDPMRYLVVKKDIYRQKLQLPNCNASDVSYYSELLCNICSSDVQNGKDSNFFKISDNNYTPCLDHSQCETPFWDEYGIHSADAQHSDEINLQSAEPGRGHPMPREVDGVRLHTPSMLPHMVEEEDDPILNEEPETEEEDADADDHQSRQVSVENSNPPSYGQVCSSLRPLKTSGTEPPSPQVAGGHHHSVSGRRHLGEINLAAILPSCSAADQKYGHLEKELANKQRAPCSSRRDRSRYASDPLDSPIHIPCARHNSIDMSDKEVLKVELVPKMEENVEDDGYLQPIATNSAAREREHHQAMSPHLCERAPPSPANRTAKIKSPHLTTQVLNPDYFESNSQEQYYNEAAFDNSKLV